MSDPEAPGSRPRAAAPENVPGVRGMALGLVAYFALQVGVRLATSSSADLDEAEQLMLTQQFSWGYGAQPPLYTWLQMGFFQLAGVSILGLSLLKNLLLLATFLLIHAAARILTASRRCAVAAAASLPLLPQVAWESQSDLTHSVLSAALAAAALACFLQACRSRQTAWYVLFGLCLGAGTLAKYNFIFWGVGLLAAAVSMREYRPAVLHRRMLAALLAGAFLLLPHGLWILRHPELAFASSRKLGRSDHWLASMETALWDLPVTTVAFLGPLLLTYALLFMRAPHGRLRRPSTPGERLLLRTWLAIAALLLILILSARATQVHGRWLLPVLVCVPVLAAALIRDALDARRLRWLCGIALVVLLTVAALLPARIVLAEKLGRPERLNLPFDALAAQLPARVPEGALLVTELGHKGGNLMAGNLRLHLPRRLVVSRDHLDLFAGGQPTWFLAWDATRSPLPPEATRQWAERHAAVAPDWSRAQYLSAPLKYHQAGSMRMGLLQLR